VLIGREGHNSEIYLFRRGDPYFFVFDLLFCAGHDCRRDQLTDRKQELRRRLTRLPADSRVKYVDHVEGYEIALFERVCELDLEGIVAKHKFAPYVSEREQSSWFKILNRGYSQKAGREELFERDRSSEPVPGWHSCVVACAVSKQDER
jgi:ATP-dependent DNA ligase